MGFLAGITGALGGLATGGPLGAAAGGLAGLLSSDSQATTAGHNLRPYTEEERAMLAQANEAIQQYMVAMSPEEREAYIQELAGTYYEPMARQIKDEMATQTAESQAFHARGGLRGSSMAVARDSKIARQSAGLLSQARAQARAAGEQSFFSRERNRINNLSAASNLAGSIANRRIAESPQYQRFTVPGSAAGAGAGMFAYGVTSPHSWWNNGGSDRVRGWFPKSGGLEYGDDFIGPIPPRN